MTDVSIIIPTLNEAAFIVSTIENARQHLSGKYKVEFILVDAGSEDSTVDLARPIVDGCWVNSNLKGAKYKSLNFGVEKSQGRALFFLDADCIVPIGFDEHIVKCLSNVKIVGGAFEFKMMRNGFIYKIVQFINRTRYRVSKNYYGDQGVFCERSVFDAIGGFPDEPIMEAAFLCRLLRDRGRLKLIRRCITSSVRRFEEGGVFNVMAKDTEIWLKFLFHMDIKKYAPDYWAENEKRK